MKRIQTASPIRYSVRIKDSTTDRKSEVYISGDLDLESLLFFLRSGGDLEYDVRDLEREVQDP